MKIALVSDWLTGMRGGERCLEAICELYPESDIFTLFHHQGSVCKTIESHKIITSYIQKLPGDKDTFRRYLPLFPNAIEKFDLNSYELVLSFSHCVAKGVKVCRNVPHICYCHTPMRYAWFMRDEYLSSFGIMKRWVADKLLDYLKNWDRKTSSRVTHFIANSKNVQHRVRQAYGCDSAVIYPPVDCSRFELSTKDDGYYLVVSALVPYKKVDVVVDAFSDMKRNLFVVGNGCQFEQLRASAASNITFIENASDTEVAEYIKNCTALVFPGEEDFGIVPLEAQACGKPVIAFSKGGALETVLSADNNPQKQPTGIFFYEQNPQALKEAVIQFEKIKSSFEPQVCRENALRFDRTIYKQKMQSYIKSVRAEYRV